MAKYFDYPWSNCSRSQFRVNLNSPFNSSSSIVPFVMDKASSTRSVRTRGLMEYEKTIEQLQAENFDLKMSNHLLSEKLREIKEAKNSNFTIEINDLNAAVAAELESRNQKLENERKLTAEYAKDLRELQERFNEQKSMLSAQREECINLNENIAELERLVSEKDAELERYVFERDAELERLVSKKDAKLERLISEKDAELKVSQSKIKTLELVSLKKSSTIQGLVNKYKRLADAVPEDLRTAVDSAVQAAKENNEEQLESSVAYFKQNLEQLYMSKGSSSVRETSLRSTSKLNSQVRKKLFDSC